MTAPNHNTADQSGSDQLRAALTKILEQPNETFSDGKALAAIVKIARAALATPQPSAPSLPQVSGDSHYSEEALTNELAAIRNLFPIPPQGSPIEEAWAASMSDPMEVSGFVCKAIAAQTAQAVPGETIFDATNTDQMYEMYSVARNTALEEAAALCHAHYKLRAEGNFPREASTARVLAHDIRTLKTATIPRR